MKTVALKRMVVLFPGLFLLVVACRNGGPSSGVSDATAPATAQVAEEEDDYSPGKDRVLGVWGAVGAEDDFEERRTCKLWPVEASDRRAVKVLRFFNDSMVSNGCCAASEWLRVEPGFYLVQRGDADDGFEELFYLDERSDVLFLVARCARKDSATAFKQEIAAFRAKGGKGTEGFLARYQRANEIKRF
ncbi:MAG: hypothetical protein LBD14_00540 [Puniceicoccales bacterium]|nr:hypothetical protein [Puniceicoccales bacterium]